MNFFFFFWSVYDWLSFLSPWTEVGLVTVIRATSPQFTLLATCKLYDIRGVGGGGDWETVNGAGAVARVLNGEDGLASHFSRPIDPWSGGATAAQLSLLHHYTITLISISPATITHLV